MIHIELDIVYKEVSKYIIIYFYFFCITIYLLVFIRKVFIII